LDENKIIADVNL